MSQYIHLSSPINAVIFIFFSTLSIYPSTYQGHQSQTLTKTKHWLIKIIHEINQFICPSPSVNISNTYPGTARRKNKRYLISISIHPFVFRQSICLSIFINQGIYLLTFLYYLSTHSLITFTLPIPRDSKSKYQTWSSYN